MSTLLRYDLTTDPFPLQASPETGNLNQATLTVVASNPNPRMPVTLKGLIITLPIGADATDLTVDANDIGPVPPAGWTLHNKEPFTGALKYIFYPDKGESQVKGAGLSFIFNNVELNRQPGIVGIEVMEGSDNCAPPACPTQQLFITKFPNGWGQVQVWTNPDPPLLPPDGSLTLNWAGPDRATYSLQYFTPRDGIVLVPAKGQPPLSNKGQYPPVGDPPLQLDQTTTFYLSVEENIDNQKYSAQQQVTATVEVFKPIINRFTGESLWADNSYGLVLKWDTQNAVTCRVTGDPHLLAPSSLDDSYLITPSLRKPLQHTYMLTAENAVGDTISPLASVQWGNIIASVPMGGNGPTVNGIAVSNDDSYLYLLGGQYGLLTKFALDSVFTGSPQPVAQFQTNQNNSSFQSNDMQPDSPIGLALSPDNNRLYVANSSGGIIVLDAATLTEINGSAPGLRHSQSPGISRC